MVGFMAESEWFRMGEMGVLHCECDILKNGSFVNIMGPMSHSFNKCIVGRWYTFGSMALV